MANTLLTISMITREALMVLENQLNFTKNVNREYDDKFAVSGAKIGTTLNVRKPPRYTVSRGQALQLQDSTETQVPVVLNTQYQTATTYSSQDLALSIDDFSKRFIQPQVAAIANAIDFDGMGLWNQIYNAVGTPGTVPTGTAAQLLTTYLNAGVALDNAAVPRDGNRALIITPAAQASAVSSLSGVFQDSSSIAEQYKKGTMGITAGFKWSMDQNVNAQTVGPLGGTPTVNATAGQTGSTIVTTGWTAVAASRLNQGDVFTIASVYSVNPQNRQSTGVLQNFVVTAPFSSDGSGNGTISISPSIVVGGQNATVSVAPAALAAITVLGSANTVSPQMMAFHRDAFTFACADLPLPGGVDMAARVASKKVGLSIRLVRAYDINTDQWPTRLDVLGGWSVLRPEMACRVAS